MKRGCKQPDVPETLTHQLKIARKQSEFRNMRPCPKIPEHDTQSTVESSVYSSNDSYKHLNLLLLLNRAGGRSVAVCQAGVKKAICFWRIPAQPLTKHLSPPFQCDCADLQQLFTLLNPISLYMQCFVAQYYTLHTVLYCTSLTSSLILTRSIIIKLCMYTQALTVTGNTQSSTTLRH